MNVKKNKDGKKSHKLSMAVQYACGTESIPNRTQFRRWIKIAQQRNVEVTIRLVEATEGCELNTQYRGKHYPTNVLTFVYDEDETLKGDVVMCVPVVASEAKSQNKDIFAHYAHLTIHAALHLQGYDHENDDDAAEMEALETQLMLELRYPNPYQEH